MTRVLFVCIHNSARSQMAEAYLNKFGGGELVAESAGFEPGSLNPVAVQAMQEEGIDISGNSCDGVFDFFKAGRRYNYIITVCDEGAAERCPIFPGVLHRIHWSFEDPSSLSGSEEEKLAKTRDIRNAIKVKTEKLVELIQSGALEENAPDDWKFNLPLNV